MTVLVANTWNPAKSAEEFSAIQNMWTGQHDYELAPDTFSAGRSFN